MFKFWGKQMIVIDGKDLILGRIATKVAKLALKGEEVSIINCEDVVIVGKKSAVIARYKQKAARGTPSTGPFIHRGPDRIVRRSIRGMIPYKTPEGIKAFRRVMCYVGNPNNLSSKNPEDIKANINDTLNINYITVGAISKQLGAKL